MLKVSHAENQEKKKKSAYNLGKVITIPRFVQISEFILCVAYVVTTTF